MKELSVLLVLGCLLSLASGQWLENTIAVPDTSFGMLFPKAFAYDSTHNTVYVGGEAYLFVIDGVTDQKIARIPVGALVSDLCFNPQDNKVYSANRGSGSVSVVDATTYAIMATISVGSSPEALCYNPQNNKVYCSNYGSDNVTVLDGAGDTVIATLAAGDRPAALCYNSMDNKVYCVNQYDSSMTVIDGASDSVVTTLAVGDAPSALSYNPQNNKVYCASAGSDTVTVVDGSADTVVGAVRAGDVPYALCYNSQNNKVYCANYQDGSVTVIDGATDSVITTITGGDGPCVLCYSFLNNKIYCANYGDGVMIIDGAIDEVVATVAGNVPVALCCNPHDNKVYSSNFHGASVTVIGGASNQVIATVHTGDEPHALCYGADNNKVYCANYYTGSVSVIDGVTNSIIATVAAGAGQPSTLCFNHRDNKVYCGKRGSYYVTVIDGAANQVIDSVAVGGPSVALCYNSQGDKVYSAAGASVTVFDGATNRMIIYLAVAAEAIHYIPRSNAVYCAGGTTMTVIDGAGDSIIATFRIPGGPHQFCYNALDNRVYCTATDTLVVLDAAAHEWTASVPLAGSPTAVCYSIQNNRVYGAAVGEGEVTVIDCRTDSVIAVVPVEPGATLDALFYNGTNNKVYCANRDLDNVAVIAGANNRLRKLIDVGVDPWLIEWNWAQNRMYVANRGNYSLTVLRDYGGPALGDLDVDPDSLDVHSDTIRLTNSGKTAVGEFVLANTSMSYNPIPSDGPSQSPVDTFNCAGLLAGPGGALDSIVVPHLPESLAQGQALVCTLSVNVPAGLQGGDYAGSIQVTGRDSAGMVVEVTVFALLQIEGGDTGLGDLDVDNDSLSIAADTMRLGNWGASPFAYPFKGYAVGEFVLANTSPLYNPDTADGPSRSPLDSVSFSGTLTGSGGTLDSILIPNLPANLAAGEAVVCSLLVYIPPGADGGDYAGSITISGRDTAGFTTEDSFFVRLTRQLGDLDIDGDTLDVAHDSMNLRTQSAGPVYHPYAEARFILANTSPTYNPDSTDGPGESALRELKVEAKVAGQSGSLDSIYIMNLPGSLAAGQVLECTLALVLPDNAASEYYSGWIVATARDTLSYEVRDSFFLTVHGPEPRQNLDSLRVAPIPFKPYQMGHDAIHFQGLTAGARVIVYDASGEAVWSATEVGDGHLAWDAKVASGIYVYLVVSADGASSKVGKLSVIR